MEGLFARMKRMLRKYRAAPRPLWHLPCGVCLENTLRPGCVLAAHSFLAASQGPIAAASLSLSVHVQAGSCQTVPLQLHVAKVTLLHPTCRPTGHSAVSCTVHSSMRQAFRVETPSAEHMSFPDLEAEFTQLKESLDWK